MSLLTNVIQSFFTFDPKIKKNRGEIKLALANFRQGLISLICRNVSDTHHFCNSSY